VLPGTLLGFYPGIICPPELGLPVTSKDVRPFMVRVDDYWIDPELDMPNILL